MFLRNRLLIAALTAVMAAWPAAATVAQDDLFATARATAGRSANMTRGCVAGFDAATDYFPDKIFHPDLVPEHPFEWYVQVPRQ